MKKILAADIGGTSSRFAAFRAEGSGAMTLEHSTWLRTGEARSFAGLIGQLAESRFPLPPGEADGAVIAIAGPVSGGVRCSPPNIPWDVDLSRPDEGGAFGRVWLINDFVAQAFATRSPAGEKAETILEGKARSDAAVAVMGAGTGLGHAALVPDGRGGYVAVSSEKGHAAFPMTTPREARFQEFLAERTGRPYPQGDTVVSGSGIAAIHRFLTGEELSPEEVTARFGDYPETLEWAARFYGRACRDYALTVLALGGLYIAGGLAARTPALVRHGAFTGEFRSSPTMAALLSRIPVFLITDQESGLWGAARYGVQMLAEEGR